MKKAFLIGIAVVVALFLAGCAGSERPSVSSSTSPGAGSPGTPTGTATNGTEQLIPAVVGIPHDTSDAYTHRISIGDVLRITVFQVEELGTEERVNPSGSIVMPLIGAIAVEGLTTEEAEHRIESALGARYLQHPQVDIFVSEYANQNITVAGEVEKAGMFPLVGRTTLIEAIAMAGGTSELADMEEVVLFRTIEGHRLNAYVIDLEAVQAGKLSDPLLVADDKILVPKSGSKVFRKNTWDALRGVISFRVVPL